MLKILIPVDGSANALRAVSFAARKAPFYKEPLEVHLVNVQHPFPGTIRGVRDEAEKYHHDEGMKVLSPARALLESAGLEPVLHIGLGEPAQVIADFVKEKNIDQVVIATRGHGAVANMLLGSVSRKVLYLVDVPVTLVK